MKVVNEMAAATMPQTYRKDALLIFLLLAFIFSYFYQKGGANGNSRFDLIFASVQDGNLYIDDYFDKPGNETIDRAYFNGHYYSDKAIGPSIVGAVLYLPVYWMQRSFLHLDQQTLKWILTFLVIGLPSAVAGSLLYILSLYLSGNRLRAYLTTLAITLGTMYLPFGVIFFSHQFTASLLFCAFFMIFFLKEQRRPLKPGYSFLIGLLLGWALISEYPSALIIVFLVIYYLSAIWRNHDYRSWRSIIFPMLGGVIPIMMQLLYNKLCFGNFLSIGYSNLEDQYFSESMSQGVMGITWPNMQVLFYATFHPTMGLFWQSPVLLLSFFGAAILCLQRRFREEGILAAGIILCYIVILSGYYMWWGGWSLGPRHLIPMLPFFGIFLSFLPKKFTWPFAGLTLVSMGQMLIAAASDVLVPDTMIPSIQSLGYFEYSNIYSYCLKLLLSNNFAPNLGQRLLGLDSWYSLIPLLVIMVAASALLFRKGIKFSIVTKVVQTK